jgi:serine phosphatase RsbU (regulator of sigma subunit)/catechol 2,3-dioxygenase-like lactoylglutathione lyase family enzyme
MPRATETRQNDRDAKAKPLGRKAFSADQVISAMTQDLLIPRPQIIISPMADDSTLAWTNRSVLRPGREGPYLCIQDIVVFVRDLDRSLHFYVDQLGFELIADKRVTTDGVGWVEVAPPDGSANLAVVAPKPDTPEYEQIGGYRSVLFMTEDVQALYKQWSERGVHFVSPPDSARWGGTYTQFEDPDGNGFGLEGFDEVRRSLELRRQEHAEKLEAERRAAHELDIAKQVQARLFPQIQPQLKTMEYAGVCLQARQVGGDYFDFLSLGPQRLGMIIGDVSGKGIAAALLMANLQASLRSQSALAFDQPEALLRSVNRLFYDNTGEAAYASLFFADYDDLSRRLRYANCGHLSGLLLRPDGKVEQLGSTSTLLGLFRDWDCSLCEQELSPGDVLALYTDGVTEACNARGEEFGERNLIDALQQHRELPCQALLTTIVDEVRQFSPQEQHDDITAIVAKCRANQ